MCKYFIVSGIAFFKAPLPLKKNPAHFVRNSLEMGKCKFIIESNIFRFGRFFGPSDFLFKSTTFVRIEQIKLGAILNSAGFSILIQKFDGWNVVCTLTAL